MDERVRRAQEAARYAQLAAWRMGDPGDRKWLWLTMEERVARDEDEAWAVNRVRDLEDLRQATRRIVKWAVDYRATDTRG